jgi:hypothetical protein
LFKLALSNEFGDLSSKLKSKLISCVNSLPRCFREKNADMLNVIAKDINSGTAEILINDILMFEDLPTEEFEFTAQKSYVPSSPETGFAGEPLREKYLPWQTPEMGAVPDIRTEEGRRFWEGKRPRFKDPDLYNKQWYLGPYADDVLAARSPIAARPDFEGIPPDTANYLVKEMQKDITDALTGDSARKWQKTLPPEEWKTMPSVPRPFLMDMVYKYLLVNEDYDAAERFAEDGVDSASRHGFQTKWILKRMFDRMPPEDLFDYWFAITQEKILPLVNPEYVDARFGSLGMGQNITSLYNAWVDNTPVIQKDIFPWEELPWKKVVEGPVEEIKQQPDQPYRVPDLEKEQPEKEIPVKPYLSKPFWNEEDYPDLMKEVQESVEQKTEKLSPKLTPEEKEQERLRGITDRFNLPFEGHVVLRAKLIT